VAREKRTCVERASEREIDLEESGAAERCTAMTRGEMHCQSPSPWTRPEQDACAAQAKGDAEPRLRTRTARLARVHM
jgi:hypothetical protein